MDYFRAYFLSADEAILAAWDSQIEKAPTPLLARALAARRGDLFPRFAVCYAELRALPRGARRSLQRRLMRERATMPVPWRKLAQSVAGAALLLALAQPAQAATIKVTTKVPGLNDGDKKCSLIEAIINANNDDQSGSVDCAAGSGDDVIVLPRNTTITLGAAYTDYAGATGLPVITSAITISGNNSKIVRSGSAPQFRLIAVGGSGDLNIGNATLSGGNAEQGGAIWNYGRLNLTRTTISGNTAGVSGGGVWNSGEVGIDRGTISKNRAAKSGGGIFTYGNVSLGHSTVTGNSAASEGGGIASYSAYLQIDHSTISKNTAGRTAGGIDNVYGTAKITDSVITGNVAVYGGGIENYSGSGRLYVDRSRIASNVARDYGGGLANINGYFKLTDSTVTGNKAANRGGGIFDSGGSPVINSGTSVSRNTARYGPNMYP